MFLNKALSFFPLFKYEDNQDVIIFTSPNIYYHIDSAGQFNENFYGMKYELIEQILIEHAFTDMNDQGLMGVFDDGASHKIISIVERINSNAVGA